MEAGSVATLTCVVCGRPRPSVEWRGPRHLDLAKCPDIITTYAEDGTAVLQVKRCPVMLCVDLKFPNDFFKTSGNRPFNMGFIY